MHDLPLNSKLIRWNDSGQKELSFENIFHKKYYYSLKNVNIIVNLKDANISIGWLFTLLKNNHKILKYQFNQLNIAISKKIGHRQELYYVLEWDKNIDAKYLYQARKQFDEMNHDDQKFKIRNNLRKNIL